MLDKLFRANTTIHLLLISILTVLVYFQVYQFDFVLDDKIVYLENQFVEKGFAGIKDILSKDTFQGYFGEQKKLVAGARYRPLSLITFAIENQIYGKNAALAHIVNVLLYLLLLFFIYRFISRIYETKPWKGVLALIITLMFALHPVHIEAVANIKGRDEILAMLFIVLGFLSTLNFVDRKRWVYLILTSLYFLLGILAKENAVLMLAAVPLLAWYRSGFSIKDGAYSLGSLTIMMVVYLGIRRYALGEIFPEGISKTLMNNPYIELSTGDKIGTIGRALANYLRLMVLPYPLTHDYYPYQIPTTPWYSLVSLTSYLFYLGMSVFCAISILKKKHLKPAIAWTIFVIGILIVSNLLFNVGTTMNERFLFVPSLGGIWLIGHFFHYGFEEKLSVQKNLRYILLGAFCLYMGIFIWVGLNRVPDWKNEWTLNSSAIQTSPNSARANLFYGVQLYLKSQETKGKEQMGFMREADSYFDRACEIYPDYFDAQRMRLATCIEINKVDGKTQDMIGCMEKAGKEKPGIPYLTQYYQMLVDKPVDLELQKQSLRNIAAYHMQKGDFQWANHFLALAQKMDEDDPETNTMIQQLPFKQ